MADNICLKCKKVKPADGFKWCPTCRKIQQSYNLKHRQNVKNHKSKTYNTLKNIPVSERPKSKKRGSNKKTFDEVLKDVDAYNESHGTNLSYGKYKMLEMQGKLKNEQK